MDKFLIIMNQTKDGVSAYLMRGGKIERNVDVKNDDEISFYLPKVVAICLE